MKYKTVIGIDPGKSGGWAKYDKQLDYWVCDIMPLTGDQVDVATIAGAIRTSEYPLVVIEKVGAMPGQGVTSMFSFGTSYGKLIGMCQALGTPFDLVTPQAWKKEILAGTKKDKNSAIEYVSRAYPTIDLIPEKKLVPHTGIADAVCIALWGYRKYVF